MPLSKFAWLNPVNVIHSFILPKATGKKAWETKHDLCPQRAHKTAAQGTSWATDCKGTQQVLH